MRRRGAKCAAFAPLLVAVRTWAQARGIYGNAFGFPGGLAWALLALAHVEATAGGEATLASFAARFAGGALPVVAPSGENTTAKVLASAARVIREELERAGTAGGGAWAEFLAAHAVFAVAEAPDAAVTEAPERSAGCWSPVVL